MFLSILNYMLAHVPGFMRPAVNWLINGLQGITSFISDRWNALGRMVDRWWTQVSFWAATVSQFSWSMHYFAVWLVKVRIPSAIAVVVNAATAFLRGLIQGARDAASTLVAQAITWARGLLDTLAARLSDVLAFARDWIDRLRTTVSGLIGALRHVLGGPEALAQWLVAALWRESIKFLRAQQDRIVLWLTRESVVFTRWLAREIEDIILRWL